MNGNPIPAQEWSPIRDALRQRAPRLADRFDALEKRVCDDVLPFVHLPDFTDHGVKHARAVEDNISRLLSDAGILYLTPFELFVVLTTTILHDIGMSAKAKASESSTEIRLAHFARGRQIIIKHHDYFGLSKHEALIVGEVCQSHGAPTLDNVRPVSISGGGTLRLPLLCALLRLGDILDVTASRAPTPIADWRQMNYSSRAHWDLHACISGVRIEAAPKWDIAIDVIPEDKKQERRLIELRNEVQDELDGVSAIFREAGLHYKRVDLVLHNLAMEKSRRGLGNPFLELAPFEAKDAYRFAGRDKETTQLVEQVLRRKVTVLIGESGVGKTSLVEAGLLPKLREYGFGIVRFSFQDDPFTSLSDAIRVFASDDLSRDAWTALERGDLVPAIDEAIKRKRNVDRVLVVGDHLEQMFTVNKVHSVRSSFVRGFYHLLDSLAPRRISFLFCMRQDYLADLYDLSREIPDLYERENTFKLYRLTRENGKQALDSASYYAKRGVSPDLIDVLLDDLCELGEGVIYPPYLQIVGYRLYAAGNREYDDEETPISKVLYCSLGGAERIINAYFEGLLDSYPQDQKPIVGQILDRMVTDHYTKKRVTKEHLARELPFCPNLDHLLNSLVDRRIVRRSLGEYELIHDCLARRVVEMVRKQTFLSPPVRKALRFMEGNFTNAHLQSDQIAKASGVTAVHLAALFRQQLGKTVNRQLNAVRIGASKELLGKDRTPIAEIARRVGFASLTSFSRKFSDIEEISPLQYRKRLMAMNSKKAC